MFDSENSCLFNILRVENSGLILSIDCCLVLKLLIKVDEEVDDDKPPEVLNVRSTFGS